MGAPVKQLEPGVKGASVIQYWVCAPVDIFQKGAHIYEIDGLNYVVMAYPADLNFATAICSKGRKIAKVEVHDSSTQNRLAHKKKWTFIAWV